MSKTEIEKNASALRKEMEKIVWAVTDRDHKSIIDGKKFITYLDKEGGTSLGLLSQVPDAILSDKFALASKIWKKRNRKLYEATEYSHSDLKGEVYWGGESIAFHTGKAWTPAYLQGGGGKDGPRVQKAVTSAIFSAPNDAPASELRCMIWSELSGDRPL
jgi:hypothetical protein